MTWLGPVLAAGAYLSGAVPYGVLIARVRGVDLRTVGSGNIGATNAARAVGKALGALVLLLDVLKGLGPALAGRWLLPSDGAGALWLSGVMISAVLGHSFSVFLRLRGGKGVATGLGVILAVAPWAGLAGIVVFAVIYAASRLASLGSLGGAAAAPAVMFWRGEPRELCLAASIIAVLIVGKHHANIRRLVLRKEHKL
jgi:acyl phosphate:glycerol-3-phosphate acyltransferase